MSLRPTSIVIRGSRSNTDGNYRTRKSDVIFIKYWLHHLSNDKNVDILHLSFGNINKAEWNACMENSVHVETIRYSLWQYLSMCMCNVHHAVHTLTQVHTVCSKTVSALQPSILKICIGPSNLIPLSTVISH